MKFFTKLKEAVETWLRGLIAAEISNLDIELRLERTALCSTIKTCDTAVDRLNELSHFKENAELRAHIKLLNEQAQAVIHSCEALHPEIQKFLSGQTRDTNC